MVAPKGMIRIAALSILFLLLSWSQISLAAKPDEALSLILRQSGEVTTPKQSRVLLDKLDRYLAQELKDLDTQVFVSAADAYGNLVAAAQDYGASQAGFNDLLARGENFFKRCRAKVRDLEQATGDREAALEKLYRSDLWHDINYALSAFSYWQAWAKLGLAHTYQGKSQQVRWLNKAEHGFQSSSVRILYPGIVYGSWLGMAYVAQARGDDELAEKRFRRLVLALAGDEDNAARVRAEKELTILAIRKGEIPSIPAMSNEPLTPTTARVSQEQAFLLLQRQRDIQSGAIEAAARLKRLIEQGYLNNALLNRIMSYRDEIAGHDIGLLTLYVDSEYAYGWQQYDTAVLKYQEFRQKGGLKLGVNVRVLQYHYAVSLLKIQMAREALKEVENLQRQTDLPQPVAQALPKLKFLVAQALYQRRANSTNRERVMAEAEHFLRVNPNDPDAASAHLILAQLSDDPSKAKRHLKIAKKNRKLKGSIGLTQVQRAVNAFNQAVVNGERARQRDEAEKVLMALADLPRAKRKKPWFKAVSLQMKTVLSDDLKKVLSSIEKMYAAAKANPDNKKYALDQRVRRVLLWSQIRALAEYEQGKGLSTFIAELANQPANAIAQKEVYLFLLAQEQQGNYSRVLTLGDVFYPALTGQPQDQRQLRLLQIRAANALGQTQRSYTIAQQLIADFPDSGNAWVAYAESAEQLQSWFEAERAWAKITRGQVEGSTRWRDAMARRSLALIALYHAEGKQTEKSVEALCKVLKKSSQYHHLMNSVEQTELDERKNQWRCQQ